MWYFILLMVISYVNSFTFLHKTKQKEIIYTESSITTYELIFNLPATLLNSGETLQTSFDLMTNPYSITAETLNGPGEKDGIEYQIYEIFVILSKYKTTIAEIQTIIDTVGNIDSMDSDKKFTLEIETNYLNFKIKNFQTYSDKILTIFKDKTQEEILASISLLTNVQVLTELLILDFRQLYKRVRELYISINLIKKGILSNLIQNTIFTEKYDQFNQFINIHDMGKIADQPISYIELKTMIKPIEYTLNKPIIYHGHGIKGQYFTCPDDKIIVLPNEITDFIGDNPNEIKCLESLNQNNQEMVIQNCLFVPFINTFSEANDGIYIYSATQDTLNKIAEKGLPTTNFSFPSKVKFSGNLTFKDNNKDITFQDNSIPSIALSSLNQENLKSLKDLTFGKEENPITLNIFSYITQEWRLIVLSYSFFTVSGVIYLIFKYLFKKGKYKYQKRNKQPRSNAYISQALQARARRKI